MEKGSAMLRKSPKEFVRPRRFLLVNATVFKESNVSTVRSGPVLALLFILNFRLITPVLEFQP